MARVRFALFALPLFFCAAGLILFPAECSAAAREGLELSLTAVLPSLFPFFVLSSLLISAGAARSLGRLFAPFMHPLFGVSGAGAGALALGLLGGYPLGARTTAELFLRGELSREEAAQLLVFCNNSGPGFFLGVCGASVFHAPRAGLYLYLIHVLSALLAGVLLRQDCSPPRVRQGSAAAAAPFRFASAFSAAVQDSFAAVWNVCGFVVLFMVLLRLLAMLPFFASLPPLLRAALFGFVEMTNGVTALPPTREGFVLCAAIMGWGGLSVQAQTCALLQESRLPLHRCTLGKTVQALLSVPLALLAAQRLFP